MQNKILFPLDLHMHLCVCKFFVQSTSLISITKACIQTELLQNEIITLNIIFLIIFLINAFVFKGIFNVLTNSKR